MPGCSKTVLPSEKDSVAETVKYAAEEDAKANGIANMNVEVFATDTKCDRRRLSGGDATDSKLHRQLQSGSSAVEFSMLITGNFRDESGGSSVASTNDINLGAIAEDSINRDKEKFIRDLADRAPEGSSLSDVSSLEVEATDAPPEGSTVPLSKIPTQQTTNAQVPETMTVIDGGEKKQGFYIAVVVVVSLIVFLFVILTFSIGK